MDHAIASQLLTAASGLHSFDGSRRTKLPHLRDNALCAVAENDLGDAPRRGQHPGGGPVRQEVAHVLALCAHSTMSNQAVQSRFSGALRPSWLLLKTQTTPGNRPRRI